MTSTRALSLSLVLSICTVAGLVALLLVANASAAPADQCDPATTERCCACEPSEAAEAAEPAPLPRIYLPSVMHMPRMSAEYTPYVPVPTVTPEVSGDVAR